MTTSSVHRYAPDRSLLDGHADVAAHLTRFRDLHGRPGTPATASPEWLLRALDLAPPASVWAVHVRDGVEEAAVVLVDRVHDGGRRTELLAGGGGYAAAVAATGTGIADRLGVVLGAEAVARGSVLHLAELPDEPRVHALAAGAGARLVASAPVPHVLRPQDGAPLVSAGMRKNLRKTHNRIAHDGVALEFEFTDDADSFAASLTDLEVAYRDRDEVHGIPCALDTSSGRGSWHARLAALGDLGRRELAVLRLDGELAAYVVGVRDGERYGVFEGRFVTRWARYSPGRLIEHEVLQRAFADDAVQLVDWMTGVAPETLLVVSGAERRWIVQSR